MRASKGRSRRPNGRRLWQSTEQRRGEHGSSKQSRDKKKRLNEQIFVRKNL